MAKGVIFGTNPRLFSLGGPTCPMLPYLGRAVFSPMVPMGYVRLPDLPCQISSPPNIEVPPLPPPLYFIPYSYI